MIGLALLGALLALWLPPGLTILALLLLIVAGAWWLNRARAAWHSKMHALEREAADLRALTAVNRAVRASLNLDDLFTTVYLQVVQQIKARYFYIALLDPMQEGALQFPLVIENRRQIAQPPTSDTTLLMQVIETRSARLIAQDVPLPGVVSWMGVPLWSGTPRSAERPLGCIVVEAHAPGPHFTKRNLEMLTVIAAQAGAAIENARLFTRTDRALDRRVRQLSALDAVAREITATLDMTRIFTLVLESAMQGTASTAGLFVLRNPENPAMMDIAVARGYPEQAIGKLSAWDCIPQEGSAGAVFRSGEALVRDEVEEPYMSTLLSVGGGAQDPVDKGEPTRAANLPPHPQARAQVSVPVHGDTGVTGVIILESATPGAYQDDALHFLTQLANQATIALRNARLFEDVRAGRDRLQAVLNSTHEGMLMIDREARVLLANPQMTALTALPSVQWRAGTLTEMAAQVYARLGFAGPEDLRELLANLQTGVLPASRPLRYQLTKRHLERSIAPIYDAVDGSTLIGLLLVLRDVTEAEKLEQTRAALSSMIVHDLRSPLAAVQGSLHLIRDFAPEAGDMSSILERTAGHSLRAIKRLQNMIESLLDISRMEHDRLILDREPTALRPIVDEVFGDLQPLADEIEVELVADIPGTPPLLDIDPGKVRRVLLNLVDNALKFTPSAQSVRVLMHMPGEAGAGSGFVRVDVIDAGPGIPDEDKKRLFDRFAQIEKRQGRRRGTGLGLTFCRVAVRAHGGHIWVEDGKTTGSVFSFTLPVAKLGPLPDDTA